ncbi:MAG TPA: hypothetical protein GX746_03620 [Bacteroidales bacterium]|nr:hypothetical protein [Bacteroidales bacterium]
MMNSFLRETNPLSKYEQNVLLPVLIKGLKQKKGRVNAVTNKQIVEALRGSGLKASERDVCRVINYIRTNDLIMGLMATSSGYYITNCEKEFINYELRLWSREFEIKKVRESIERQRKMLFIPKYKQIF